MLSNDLIIDIDNCEIFESNSVEFFKDSYGYLYLLDRYVDVRRNRRYIEYGMSKRGVKYYPTEKTHRLRCIFNEFNEISQFKIFVIDPDFKEKSIFDSIKSFFSTIWNFTKKCFGSSSEQEKDNISISPQSPTYGAMNRSFGDEDKGGPSGEVVRFISDSTPSSSSPFPTRTVSFGNSW